MKARTSILKDNTTLAAKTGAGTFPDTVIEHADTERELRACFPIMQQLRPHLRDEEDFMSRLYRMRAEDYRLLAAWQADEPIALAGYRYQENLVYGRFLYVDDLVVAEPLRGSQWGAKLLETVEGFARKAGCARFVLDTGLSNALAQRFYFRQGLLTGAMRFSKPLP
ncbi:GNAT family N-acetyltransferase [Allopusillimonas ginsengisoli]|nr:GNAT family N-acetyltransferase [Allopusillimonas ginsengisoli]TEA80083.1 GNAT family N-acetyltransferase [Allopusillimonas ginsengisoli]